MSLKEALFAWLFDNLTPSVAQLIKDTPMAANQQVLDALTELKTHAVTIETALTAAQARDAATTQLLADLKAQVASGADQTAVLASIADIQTHIDADATRVDALDGGAAVTTNPPAGQ